MTSKLLQHWQRLEASVHPADKPFFATADHSFNLDFPPPAFIGDIEHAPVVLLDANGGYSQETSLEFPDARSVARYIDLLHSPKAINPSAVAPYYGQRNYAKMIQDGQLALVNAVAYRSVSISKEPSNKKIAERLPSTHIHRTWLREELLPSAKSGDRLVIAHRNGLWKLSKNEGPMVGVIFTTNPISPDLSKSVLAEIRDFVKAR